jgi:hypothetical protein
MATSINNVLRQYKKYHRKPTPKSEPVKQFASFRKEQNVLMDGYYCWMSGADWRKDVRRSEEFVFGDQWKDMVRDAVNHRTVSERSLMMEQGVNPSQYNIIRNIIRTISGVWGQNKTLPVCVSQTEDGETDSEILTATLQALYRKDETSKLDMAIIIQLAIAGVGPIRCDYNWDRGDLDVHTDYIDPFTFIVDNTMKDPRYRDCGLVGCFYDKTLAQVISKFGHGDAARINELKRIYANSDPQKRYEMVSTFTDERIEKDFFVPGVENLNSCRVFEIWRLETKEGFNIHDRLNGTFEFNYKLSEQDIAAINEQRIAEQSAAGVAEEDMLLLEAEPASQDIWHYYYLTPYGDVLQEGDNPFWHGNSPFVFEIHSFFIGKIYPLIKDIIDTQKQVNKLSATTDLLMKYAAKNLLFVPTQSISTEYGGLETIERKAASYDAVIAYDAKAGIPQPNFVSSMDKAFAPLSIVNMYLEMGKNISGVFGALQGQAPMSGTPAAMYAQQTQNSATSLVDFFQSMESLRLRRDKMRVQLMQQFYTEPRWVFFKQKNKQIFWDADKVRRIEFETNVVENTDTPAFRLMMNDVLLQLKQYDTQNMLDFRGLIEAGNWPFKEPILDYLNQREKDIAQGRAAQPMTPELQQQLSQGYMLNPELQQQMQANAETAQPMPEQQVQQPVPPQQ